MLRLGKWPLLSFVALGLMAPVASAQIAGESYANFSPSEGWWVWWPAERGPAPFKISFEPVDPTTGRGTGMKLEVAPRREALNLVLFAPPLRSMLLESPEALVLVASATGVPGVGIGISMMDRRGAGFLVPGQPLAAGPKPAPLRFEWARDRKFGWGAKPEDPPQGAWNVHELTVAVPPSEKPVVVRLAGLRVVGARTPITAFESRLVTGDPNGLFLRAPGDPTSLRLRLTSLPNTKIRVEVSQTDWQGRALNRKQVIERANDAGDLLVPLDPVGPLGLRNVLVEASDDQGRRLNVRHTYAVFHPVGAPKGRQEFLFGLQGEEEDKWIRAAAMAGAGIFRSGADLRETRPDPARPYDLSGIRRRVGLIRELGMIPQLLVAYGIPWAIEDKYHHFETNAQGQRVRKTGWPDGFIYPVKDDVWREWIRTLATTMKGQVPYYEIWNEPDITVFWRGTNDEYLRMLRSASQEIRRADPAAKVGTGGMAFPPFERDVYGFGNPMLQEDVLAKAQRDFDVHFLHLHYDYAGFRYGVENGVLPVRKKHGVTSPMLFNETSYSEHLPERELIQAGELWKKFTYAWSQRAMGLVWFKLHMNPDDVPSEYGYSMFRGPGAVAEPKAVFPAFAALARLLRGHRYERELSLGEGRVGFQFGRSDGKVGVVWQQDPDLPQSTIALDLGEDSRAEVIDLMGNAEPMTVDPSGRAVVKPGPLPIAIRVMGPKARIRELGPLVRAIGSEGPDRPVLVAADANEAEIVLSFRGIGPSTVRASASLGTTGAVALVKPGEETRLAVPLKESKLDAARASGYVNVGWQIGSTSGSLRVNVVPIWTFGKAGPEARVADIKLGRADQATNFFVGVPDRARDIWSGPRDLSVEGWMWAANGTLHLRISADDDVHVAGGPGENLWRGDSVQWAIAVPGRPDFWELGAARMADGSTSAFCWLAPAGLDKTALKLEARVTREGTRTVTDIEVPAAALGLDEGMLERGIRTAIAVNDADSPTVGRKSALQFGGGLTVGKRPEQFARVRFW